MLDAGTGPAKGDGFDLTGRLVAPHCEARDYLVGRGSPPFYPTTRSPA